MKVQGTVTPNNRLGTKLGYPTANIAFQDESFHGIYVGYTSLIRSNNPKVTAAFSGKGLPSLIFIGRAEMFAESMFKLESHILDFPAIDLYDSEIEVEVSEKLRESKKYESDSELVRQMKRDETKAREWFKRNHRN